MKNKKNVKNVKIEMDVIHQITMLLQIGLAVFLVSFGIASFFCKELYMICQILIGLIMFVIAFNNHTVYKRRYMTAIYLGLGIVIIAASLFA